MDLLARERKETYLGLSVLGYEERKGAKKYIKIEAHEKFLQEWKAFWGLDTSGRWTHQIISQIRPMVERKHGEVRYYLTQAMTRHTQRCTIV